MKTKIWSWNDSPGGWVEVAEGGQEDVLRRYRTAAEHEVIGAAFVALPAGQAPRGTPKELGVHLTDLRPFSPHGPAADGYEPLDEEARRAQVRTPEEQARLRKVMDDFRRPVCPDDGACHHECPEVCWRVSNARPFSGVYPDDRWPAAVQLDHAPVTITEDQLAQISEGEREADQIFQMIPEAKLAARDRADALSREAIVTLHLHAVEPGQIEALLEALEAVVHASPVRLREIEAPGYDKAYGAGDDRGWVEYPRG